MTLEECYRALGGSYSDVLARLVDDKMITKYLNKFTKDTSYRDIFAALENNDYETAFRAAHTLKGICLNLGLENLYKAAYKVTEDRRPARRAAAENGRNHSGNAGRAEIKLQQLDPRNTAALICGFCRR